MIGAIFMDVHEFIEKINNDDNMRERLQQSLESIPEGAEPEVHLSEIVEFARRNGYSFDNEDYMEAAREFAQRKVKGVVDKFSNEKLRGPGNTGGFSCVSACPTTNHAGCD